MEEFKRVIFFCFLLKLEIAQKHPDIYAVPVKTQKSEQNWPQPMRYSVSSSRHSVLILDFAGRRKTDLARFCSYESSCLGISFCCSASKIIVKVGQNFSKLFSELISGFFSFSSFIVSSSIVFESSRKKHCTLSLKYLQSQFFAQISITEAGLHSCPLTSSLPVLDIW